VLTTYILQVQAGHLEPMLESVVVAEVLGHQEAEMERQAPMALLGGMVALAVAVAGVAIRPVASLAGRAERVARLVAVVAVVAVVVRVLMGQIQEPAETAATVMR